MSQSKKPYLTPLANRVLVRVFDEDQLEKKTTSTIILPDTVEKEKPEQGEVVAVGEGKMKDGERVSMEVSVGDKVMFSKFGGETLTIEDQDYRLLSDDNILAIIN